MPSTSSLEIVSTIAEEKVYPWQILSQLHQIVHHHLAFEQLRDRLEDLPRQFLCPQPRPWGAIDWHRIDCTQIIGMPRAVFLSAIAGAVAVETPIRSYASVSWRYLEQLHPQMAKFVGGTFDQNYQLIEPGLWEKEERQHGPALSKLYYHLTGQKLMVQPKAVKGYQPTEDPREDLFRHGLHRVMTEYGATCLYLWLMAHTTGALRQLLGELLQDEINHMTKFWGFGLWAYPDSYGDRIWRSLKSCLGAAFSLQQFNQTHMADSHLRSTVELICTFNRVMDLVNWSSWPVIHQAEVVYIFAYVLNHLLRWSNTLTRPELERLFA